CLNFQLHSWSSGLMCSIDLQKRLNKPKTSFFVVGGCATSSCGLGDKALQECNLSTEPSMDCSECIPPGAEAMSRTGCLLLAMPLQAMVKAQNSSNSLGRRPPVLLGLPTNSATQPIFFQLLECGSGVRHNKPKPLIRTLLVALALCSVMGTARAGPTDL